MMVILDRFVIGSVLGAKAVTYYTVPFQLAERTTMLPGALASALFPRLAAAGAKEAGDLADTAICSLAVVMTPLMLIGLFFVEPFLRWWLNPEFASRAGLTAQILLLGFWINSFARVPYALLQAVGNPAVVAKCHLAELTPYLVLLYVGLHFFGLPGAAVVFGLRTLVDCALLLWAAGILGSGVAVLKIPIFLLLTGLGVAAVLPTGSAIWWLAAFGLLLLSLTWSCLNAPPAVRSLAIRNFNKLPINKPEKFL